MVRLCWLLIVLGLALPAHVHARHPALHWTRSDEAAACIDPLTLAERVEALTGPVFLLPADYVIEGHVEARDGKFVAHIAISGAHRAERGTRVVEQPGPDCHKLDESLVFVIALMIDPDLDLERLTGDARLEGRNAGEVLLRELEAEPPSPPVAPPTTKSPEPQEPEPPPRVPPVHGGSYRWEGSFALVTAADAIRGVSLGSIVGAVLPLTRSLEVAAQARILVRAGRYEVDGARSLSAQSFSFAPLLCARTPSERLSLRGCAGPESSLVRARGRGFDPDQRASLSVWGALAKVEFAYRVADRWSLSLQGFVRRGFGTKRFVYTSEWLGRSEDVARLAAWIGGAALGVAYRFGSGISRATGTDLRDSEDTP